MAPLSPTRDMGSHSDLCCRVTNRLRRAHNRAEGPIAERTRSQDARTTRPSSTNSPSPISKPTPNRVTKTRAPTSSAKNASPHRDQARAKKQLCRTRLQLKKYLESDEFRDDRGSTRFSIHQQIQQLSPLSPTGALGRVPEPQPARWKTPERIANDKARQVPRSSPLRTVERVLTDEEMYDEYTLLPGEIRDDEVDFDAEMEVMECETVDGRVVEDLMDGKLGDGVWRNVQGDDKDDVEKVAHWAQGCNIIAIKSSAAALMDTRCRNVVAGVWRMAGA